MDTSYNHNEAVGLILVQHKSLIQQARFFALWSVGGLTCCSRNVPVLWAGVGAGVVVRSSIREEVWSMWEGGQGKKEGICS